MTQKQKELIERLISLTKEGKIKWSGANELSHRYIRFVETKLKFDIERMCSVSGDMTCSLSVDNIYPKYYYNISFPIVSVVFSKKKDKSDFEILNTLYEIADAGKVVIGYSEPEKEVDMRKDIDSVLKLLSQ